MNKSRRDNVLAICTWIVGVCLPSSSPSSGAYTIDAPKNNPTYFYTSGIVTRGGTTMGVDVTVNLEIGSVIHATHFEDVGPNSMGWDKDFVAPVQGWAVSDNFKCQLYDSMDNPVANEPFEITDQVR